MKKFAVLFLACFTLLSATVTTASEKTILKNVRIRVDGKKEYYVLFQSPGNSHLWYCGQVKPKIIERKDRGKKIPEISIIRFQKKDPKDPQTLLEGGKFRMHLALGPSDKARKLLQKKIPAAKDGKPITLSPVPFDALQLYFINKGKKIKMHADALRGISTKQLSRAVAFSTTINVLEIDLLESLLRGHTGAKYILEYNYKYIDPVFQPDTAVAYNPGSSGQRDLTNIAQDSTEQQPRELSGSRDFARIAQDAAAEVGWEKAGQGFIGFSRYDKDIQDMCVFIEKNPGQWDNAYLTLPIINQMGDVTIDKITIEACLSVDEKKYTEKTLTWTSRRGWRDRYGAPLFYGVFSLKDYIRDNPGKLGSAKFMISQRINSNGKDVLESKYDFPVTAGEAPISDPLQIASILAFETSFLTWSEPNCKNGLTGMEIDLNEGNWKAVRTIKTSVKNGKVIFPESLQWLVANQPPPDNPGLLANVFFLVNHDGKQTKVPWRLNNKDLRKCLSSFSTVFFDCDWQEQ